MLADDKGNPSPAMRAKKLVIGGPDQPHALRKVSPGPARLLAWDYQADLSLLVIDNGPFNYIPVAPEGFKPDGTSIRQATTTWPGPSR